MTVRFVLSLLLLPCLVFQAKVYFYPKLKSTFLEIVSNATNRVLVNSYAVDDPDVLKILKALDSKGLDVRVVSEIPVPGLENRIDSDPKSLLHAKFAVVDGIVVFGSANFTEGGLTEDMNDFIVFDEPDVVSFFSDLFESVWRGDVPPSEFETDTGTFLVSPFVDLERIVSEKLSESEKSVDIAIFAFTDTNVLGLLKYLTYEGVDVRIVADDWCEENPSFLDYPTDQFDVKVLKNLHHKFILIDGSVLITGSSNITESGYHKNFEVIFVTKDPRIVGEYVEYFNGMWR